MTFTFVRLLTMAVRASIPLTLWHALIVAAVILFEAHGLGEVSIIFH